MKSVYGKVDLSGWNLDGCSIRRISIEIHKAIVKDGSAWFPYSFYPKNGVEKKVPKDPLTIYVDLPLTGDEDGCQFSMSLRNTWDCPRGAWKEGDNSWAEGGRRFIDAMRSWCDEIEKDLAIVEKNERS